MALSRADGGRATIVSVTREKLASPRDFYNFEVEGFHTYFVASAGVWVHNACGGRALNEGIYVIREKGKVYVGQSGDIAQRFARGHKRRFSEVALRSAQRIHVKGGELQREIAEQRMKDRITRTEGREVLLNKRNPIGSARIRYMGPGYRRP